MLRSSNQRVLHRLLPTNSLVSVVIKLRVGKGEISPGQHRHLFGDQTQNNCLPEQTISLKFCWYDRLWSSYCVVGGSHASLYCFAVPNNTEAHRFRDISSWHFKARVAPFIRSPHLARFRTKLHSSSWEKLVDVMGKTAFIRIVIVELYCMDDLWSKWCTSTKYLYKTNCRGCLKVSLERRPINTVRLLLGKQTGQIGEKHIAVCIHVVGSERRCLHLVRACSLGIL